MRVRTAQEREMKRVEREKDKERKTEERKRVMEEKRRFSLQECLAHILGWRQEQDNLTDLGSDPMCVCL